jgi:hypothetical protein
VLHFVLSSHQRWHTLFLSVIKKIISLVLYLFCAFIARMSSCFYVCHAHLVVFCCVNVFHECHTKHVSLHMHACLCIYLGSFSWIAPAKASPTSSKADSRETLSRCSKHGPCTSMCGKVLSCGHTCCHDRCHGSEECLPCKQKCIIKCAHS